MGAINLVIYVCGWLVALLLSISFGAFIRRRLQIRRAQRNEQIERDHAEVMRMVEGEVTPLEPVAPPARQPKWEYVEWDWREIERVGNVVRQRAVYHFVDFVGGQEHWFDPGPAPRKSNEYYGWLWKGPDGETITVPTDRIVHLPTAPEGGSGVTTTTAGI